LKSVHLVAEEAEAVGEELGDGRRRLTVYPTDPGAFVTYPRCETGYPLELIERMFEVRGRSICDDILRDEDPSYVELDATYGLFAYLDPKRFTGKRLLDFGCGSGAATVVLARLLPETDIVGVDLDEDLIELARLRARHRGVDTRFLVSPAPDRLPDVGEVDFVVLHAVYEHLLPAERPRLLRQLWSLLKPGGNLFLHATPNRWYPLEQHTTRIWGLNYLPDRLALRAAHRFSRQFGRTGSWEQLLRRGIRGATRGEILRTLGDARLLRPCQLDCLDEIDIWYAQSMLRNPRSLKSAIRIGFKLYAGVTGRVPTPSLTIALERPRGVGGLHPERAS
jgi:2-polyprenyl-3-methyl-5-hydroxy-6-metoxy-1,4-benzoquinol methylase